ncbi:MAG: thiol peroxidase [Spiroplasma sp.]|nr:thiol peroxidase [Spiroplasma sp.]
MIELKIQGTPVQIKKTPIKVNQILEFQAIDSLNNLQVVNLKTFQGTKKIISSIPSLDTNTCAIQTTKFNQYAAKNFNNYQVITISKDLPFAQSRFCKTLSLNKNFHVWSDYMNNHNSFANQTNLLIDQNQLLARCVMVLDENNKVLYQQIVKEVANEPDYQQVINFIEALKK